MLQPQKFRLELKSTECESHHSLPKGGPQDSLVAVFGFFALSTTRFLLLHWLSQGIREWMDPCSSPN